MKTKFSKLRTLTLLVFMAIFCFQSYAAYIPVVIPISKSLSGGVDKSKQLIGILIALNIIGILIILIRSLIWVIKKPDYTYIEYVWYSDYRLMIPTVNLIVLLLLDGIAFSIALGIWISNFI